MRALKYSDAYVATVKGLMLYCGMGAKSVSALSGVPLFTCYAWRSGKWRGGVSPDPRIRDTLKRIVGPSPVDDDSVVSGTVRLLEAQAVPANPEAKPG